MGKLACICGYILSDNCGCDGEAFSEDQIQFVGFNEDYYYPVSFGRSILECPHCGALAIEDPIETCYVKFYKPDNGKYNKLFHDHDYVKGNFI